MRRESFFDRLVRESTRLGCLVVVRDHDGVVRLLIRHPKHGPIVEWCTFHGSIEETARYALLAVNREKEATTRE